MSKKLQLDEYKQQVADSFDRRSNNYDNADDFHPRLAHFLIEYSKIQSGQKILDIATGTGLVAIEAAEIVGSKGQVVGVDISTGMLNQAKRKIEAVKLSNIEFLEADAENLDFPENSFDRILCCSSLPFLTDIPAALGLWYRLLKPKGLISLCVFAETAFIAGNVLREVASRYSIYLPNWSEATGTEDKCYEMLQKTGFEDVEVKTEQLGNYISLSEAKGVWEGSIKHLLCRPLQQLESEELDQIKAGYFVELEKLVTDRGIWNDITTFFILGSKPENKFSVS